MSNRVTVSELIDQLRALERDGHGDKSVLWNGMTHSWPVELKVTTRNSVTVVLVNA